MNMLTKEQAYKILEDYGTPPHVIRHCEAVSDVAFKVGSLLKKKGIDVDPVLAQTAGLLHDMARTQDDHQNVAAEWLRERGYDEVADIVAVHMTYTSFSKAEDTTETDLVCLGDRVCIEGEYVGAEKRFEYIINKALQIAPAHVPVIKEKKIQMIGYIEDLEKIMGVSLDDLMGGRK